MMRVFLLCLLFVAGVSSCTNTEYDEAEDTSTLVRVGNLLPHFSVSTDAGDSVSDTSLKGKVSVLIFFNTNCPDCQKELPIINTLYNHEASRHNFQLIAISRAESDAEVSSYWHQNGFTIPYSAQADRTVYSLFATSNIPRIYIANRQGVIVYVSSDNNMPDAATLEDIVESL